MQRGRTPMCDPHHGDGIGHGMVLAAVLWLIVAVVLLVILAATS